MKSKQQKRTEAIERQKTYNTLGPVINLNIQRANGHKDTTRQSKRLIKELVSSSS